MADHTPVTPLPFNDLGDGWHLEPRRRLLLWMLIGLVVLVLGAGAITGAASDDNVLFRVTFGVIALFVLAIAFEPRPSKAPRMYESPSAYGLLLPTHPVKISLVVLMGVLGALLCIGPSLAVLNGQGEGSFLGQLVACVFLFAFGLVFAAGAAGGIVSLRTPHRGILLTIDGVVLQTQKPPATFAWQHCSGLRAHWTRRPSSRTNLRTPDDVANWLSFVVDPEHVDGGAPLEFLTRTKEPTVNAKDLALDPRLALAVCRFYLDDAEARAELRTPAALDRVASIERSVGASG